MKNIHRQLLDYLRSGEKIVLATVIRTSGSTPQKPGSSALFSEKEWLQARWEEGSWKGKCNKLHSMS
ncbi:MAG: XdhC family protein [Bacteroidota bacterium]